MTNLFLLAGAESFLKEEFLHKLRQDIAPAGDEELFCQTYYSEDNDADLSTAINQKNLFAKNRLIIIRNVERLSKPQKNTLLNYLKNPSKHTWLVMETSRPGLEDEFLYKLAEYAKPIECNKIFGLRLYNWIYKQMSSYKKSISKDAIDLVLELKGCDLRTLAMELDKLITFIGNRSHITKEDIEHLVGKDVTNNTFDLVDAISRRDYKRSLELINSLARTARRDAEIIGLVGWQFRRLWKGKRLEESKMNKANIARALKIAPSFVEKFFDELDLFDLDQIKRNLKILLETDRTIKTAAARHDLVLELMTVRLCSA